LFHAEKKYSGGEQKVGRNGAGIGETELKIQIRKKAST
jgi:hypothetical protein